MQPSRSSDVRPPISAARDAYFRGDFDACSAALDCATNLLPGEAHEALLLRARVLMRTLRFREVVALLEPILPTFSVVDEAVTAKMLHAVGVLRSGDPDSIKRGMALLHDVHVGARTFHAHRAIVGEIDYWIAFGHWLRRDYHATLKHAFVAEGAEADVLSVRAASLRGYVAAAKEHYHEALALFRSALEKYKVCRERDADLVERIVFQIVALEVALRSASVPGTHHLPPDIGTRLVDIESPNRIPGSLRMQIASLDAWNYAFDGERDKAYLYARIGEMLAPDVAGRVYALANRAQITALFGDIAAARQFAMTAVEITDKVDWENVNEERLGLLLLAEALAMTDPAFVEPVFARYQSLTTSVDPALMHDDVRLWILETYVRGLVHRIRDELTEAWEAFQAVRAEAQRVGIVWRAALALIEMDATPKGGRADFYLEAAARMVRQHFPRSFLARRLGKWNHVYRDPILSGLPPFQRRVLRHICEGQTQKEIAEATGLAVGTVTQYVKALLKAFGVRSSLELVVRCYQRGIGAPSWWADEPDRQALFSPPTAKRTRRRRSSA